MNQQPSLFEGEALGRDWPFAGLDPMAYDLIMADPPWAFELYSQKGEAKSAQAHYACMSTEAIAALPVGLLARSDALLWLWATWPLLPAAMSVIEAWGLRYVTGGAWHKKTVKGKTAFGTGYRLRCACEPFLIATTGSPITSNAVRNLIEGRNREHSAKPDEAYAAAEALMPRARRVELFSRRSRLGWETWGDQSGRLDATPPPPTTEQTP